MTRTDVMASSRPQAQTAKSRRGSFRAWRRLIVLPVVLLLGIALVAPTGAVAATTNSEGLAGYSKKTEEKNGTSPSKETSTPEKKEAAPATSSSAPAAEKAAKASTLPFTGLDIRWILGMGLILVGAGFSIVTVQGRHRRDGRG
jgi:hypothetical protein